MPMKEEQNGYLTVFLSLMFTLIISLFLVLLYGVKSNTAYAEGECVTDIAMNNILAEYHRELFRQYDLFYIDCSYGTPVCDYENTRQHLLDYANKNLTMENVFMGNIFHNPSGLSIQDVEITKASLACDDKGAVLRRQAVEIMKQKVGLSYINQVKNWVCTVEQYGLHTKDLLAEEQKVVEEIQKWDENFTEDMVDEKNNAGTIVRFWKNGVLYYVIGNSVISAQSITPKYYLSGRERVSGTGMQAGVTYEDSFLDKLWFDEYILAYTGHYGAEKLDGLLYYQTEYIIAGKKSDADNLDQVVRKILGIRGAANLVSLLQDETKKSAAKAAGLLLAAVLQIPELEKLFTVFLEILWSMAEAIYDVACILQGKKIPLIKQTSDWFYSLEGIFSVAILGNVISIPEEEGAGLGYEDYLRLLLSMESTEEMTYRLMDIMEMDIRQTKGNEHFRMDGCMDGLTAIFYYRDGNGHDVEIERSYGY